MSTMNIGEEGFWRLGWAGLNTKVLYSRDVRTGDYRITPM